MSKTLMLSVVCALCTVSLYSLKSVAEVELPSDELSQETVLPSFENSTVVKNRNVTLSNRIETSLYYGWNFSEPIENQSKVGVNLGYHFNEVHTVTVNYASWGSGLNPQYTGQLAQAPNLLDFSRSPQLQNSIWVNWEGNLFYGKISLAKKTVTNFHLYPIAGIGQTAYTNKSYLGANVGAGWKFYFNSTWAFRMDLKFQYSGKPSPFLGGGSLHPTSAVPLPSAFGDTTAVSTILDVGIAALF